MTNENRIGQRRGKVSELTVIAPLVPGGAEKLRAVIAGSTINGFEALDGIGTVHDARFTFLDNDTRILFATTYDGDWDTYIDDFATKIPDIMDLLFSVVEGWPGMRSPEVKDFIAASQIPAHAWYTAYDATVSEVRKGLKAKNALDELLDQAG
ncbi:hypothetical protein ACFWPQ_07755 [Streptomyces sp. NPDC058464]|uniref:hypothetical protein n=1 Tax=Streptomyces sp. NPDC058464 TaxID=3346511 RepID=UPI00365D0562